MNYQRGARLALELDPDLEVPTLKRLWPVYRHHDALTPYEEELAFGRFQQARFLALHTQRARARAPLPHEEETLYFALRNTIDVRMQTGVQGGAQLKHATDGFYQGRANMRVPCKVEWEAMRMAERRQWIIDE